MNINKASAQELENTFQLDGTRARYLEDYRSKHGEFASWDQVKQVPSFDDGMINNLRAAGLTLGPDTHSEKSSRSGDGGSDAPSRGRQQSSSTDTKTGSQSASQRGSSRSSGHRDLNDASEEELQRAGQLDGQRSRYLVDARNRLGRFTSWEQVKQEVPSFEDRMIERLQQAGFEI